MASASLAGDGECKREREMMMYPVLSDSRIILGSGIRIGSTNHTREVVSLPSCDLMHTLCTGKSGYGKSRWLCALAVLLLRHNIGFTLIDPAGDLGRLILRQLLALGYFDHHPDPFSNLLYLDVPGALAKERYLPFNVLRTHHDPYTAADLVLEALKRAFPSLKGGVAVNIETLVRLGAFVLASHQLPLFPHLYTLLTEESFRTNLLANISDQLVVQFFQQHTNPRTGQIDIGVESTLKRILLICFAPVLRHSLGQADNLLDFRSLMAQGRSVILNINLADLEAMRLLGCLVTVQAETGAKARGQLPAEQRHGTHVLLIDEFPTFSSQSGEAFAQILDQCRKMGLFLVLAHQSWAQVPPQLRSALNNCDIRVAFRQERADAEISAPLLHFPINPYLQKPTTNGRPHFYSSAEQRELHIQAITQLAKREAFVMLPGDHVYRLDTLSVPDVAINAERIAAVEEEYVRRYFRPPPKNEFAILTSSPIPAYDHAIQSQPEGKDHDDESGYLEELIKW